MQQRKHGEWKLQSEHDLAQRKQDVNAGIAANADD